MPDFSKCLDQTCPSRWFCERYTAPDGYQQSYTDFDRYGREKCRAYLPNKGAPDVLDCDRVEGKEENP